MWVRAAARGRDPGRPGAWAVVWPFPSLVWATCRCPPGAEASSHRPAPAGGPAAGGLRGGRRAELGTWELVSGETSNPVRSPRHQRGGNGVLGAQLASPSLWLQARLTGCLRGHLGLARTPAHLEKEQPAGTVPGLGSLGRASRGWASPGWAVRPPVLLCPRVSPAPRGLPQPPACVPLGAS